MIATGDFVPIDSFAFNRALDAFDAAAACRRVADAIDASADGIDATLDAVIDGFTTDVWDSAVADVRRSELDELRRGLRLAGFELGSLAVRLRGGAVLHDRDGAAWFDRYLASLDGP